ALRPRESEDGRRLERRVGEDEAARRALELRRTDDPHDAIAGPLSTPLLAPLQTGSPGVGGRIAVVAQASLNIVESRDACLLRSSLGDRYARTLVVTFIVEFCFAEAARVVGAHPSNV